RFVLLAREFHIEREWGDVLETVWKKYPLLKTVGRLPGLENQNLEPQRTRRNTEGAEDRVIGNGGTAEGRRESTGRDANRGMRLGKVVAAALAGEILRAGAVGSAQQSAIGTQAGNWQIANGNWPERQDQEFEGPRTSAAEAGTAPSSTAGINACSTPLVGVHSDMEEGTYGNSTPSLGSVAQGRLCSTPVEPAGYSTPLELEYSNAQRTHHGASGMKT